VVGVVFDDTVSSATNFAAHYGSLYPSIIDPGGTVANSYGVVSPPTTFVINRQGRVAVTLLGATTAKQLAAVVARVSS
jgi:peroxiredoxin